MGMLTISFSCLLIYAPRKSCFSQNFSDGHTERHTDIHNYWVASLLKSRQSRDKPNRSKLLATKNMEIYKDGIFLTLTEVYNK